MRVESEGEPGTSQSGSCQSVDGVDAQKEKVKNPKAKHELRETC